MEKLLDLIKLAQDNAGLPPPHSSYVINSKRRDESWISGFLISAFSFFVLCIVIPSGVSLMLVCIFGFLVSFFNLSGSQIFETYILAFYIFFFMFVLAIGTIFEAITESIKNFDHVMRRALSIGVVGLSDLVFKGRPQAAVGIYIALIVLLSYWGYYFCVKIFPREFFRVFNEILKTGGLKEFGPLLLFKLGLFLTYAVVFLALPVLAVAVPSWRKMAIRPLLTGKKTTASSKAKEQLGNTLRVAHISDLHVREKIASSSNPNVMALLNADQFGADVIALTGDLTDKGTIDAWRQFVELPQLSHKDQRIVMVPGNHDLNTWHPSLWLSPLTLASPTRTGAHQRAYLYLQVAAQVMGDRTWVVCPFTQGIRRLSAVYEQASPSLKAWDQGVRGKHIIKPFDFLENLFPMVVCTRSKGESPQVASMVWNTIKANRWAWLNSVGELGADQVKRGEKLLSYSAFAELPVLHMMHHQLAVPGIRATSKNKQVGRLNFFHTLGMGLETAEHFLSFIRKRSQRTCVLHGHHHKYFVCTEPNSGVSIVSAPSSKFGVEVSFSDDVKANSDTTWLGLVFSVDGVHLDLIDVKPM